MDPNIPSQPPQSKSVIQAPLTQNQTNNPKNKMNYLNKFFIYSNTLLFFLFIILNLVTQYDYSFRSPSCTMELSCMATLFIILGFPFLLIFYYGIMKVIYDHSNGITVNNFTEIKHSGTFKSYLKLSLLLLFVSISIPSYTEYKIASEIKINKQEQLDYQKANPWEARDRQRGIDENAISQAILSYKIVHSKFPEDLDSLNINGYRVPLDPLTKTPYIYFYNNNTGNFVVCAKGEKSNSGMINCEQNGQSWTNYSNSASIVIMLNKGSSLITCYCNDNYNLSVCIKVDCSSIQEQISDCNAYCKSYGRTNTSKTPSCISNSSSCIK